MVEPAVETSHRPVADVPHVILWDFDLVEQIHERIATDENQISNLLHAKGQVRSLSSPSADVGIRVPEQTERDSQVFGLIPTKGLRFFLLLGHPRESDHDHDGERRKSKPSFRSDGLEPSGPTFGGKPVAK